MSDTSYPLKETEQNQVEGLPFNECNDPYERSVNCTPRGIKAPEPTPAEQTDIPMIMGASTLMRELYAIMKRVSLSDRPILLNGPTGSGKEIVAQQLHQLAPRHDKPFIAVNCSAFSETLIESQLFGYERGAFTGADARKIGYLEAVGEGTLFLDEIGELPLLMQPRLLRVIETFSFSRLGSTKEIKFRGRIIAATHRNLEQMVQNRSFREDLLYRINVFTLKIPPLNNRREDIPDLIAHFARSQHRPIAFDNDAIEMLTKADWPGNVRQLRNTIDRIAVLTDERVIAKDVAEKFIEHLLPIQNSDWSEVIGDIALQLQAQDKLMAIENKLIDWAMQKALGNKSEAARILGVHRKRIERRVNKCFSD